MTQASAAEHNLTIEGRSTPLFGRRALVEICVLFLAAAVVLFLFSVRYVNVYDEGILLTDAMSVMHREVPYRDFYCIYGPAELYVLAGLFRVFGPSVLVARLAAIFCNSLLVVTLYVLTRRYCGRAVAVCTAIAGVVWVLGLPLTTSLMNPLLCALTCWTAWLIVPVGNERLQRRRALWAGCLAGITFLFRFDFGLAVAAANLVSVAAMMWMQRDVPRRPFHGVLRTMIGPYIATFVVTILPFAVAYLSVAPLHDLLYDVLIFNSKYYPTGRRLPFPVLRLGQNFYELGIYLVLLLTIFGLWAAASWAATNRSRPATEAPVWMNLLVALSFASAIVCVKGLVRVGIGAMYGSVIACLLIAALLISHRDQLNAWLKGLTLFAVALFMLTALSAAHSQIATGFHLKPIVLNRILTPKRQPPFPPFQRWCHDRSSITRGFCYLMDDDHIQAVQFLTAHTGPGDYLFVGLDHHDRIIENDMMTYFAVQRLPAVKWAHFDPFLENRADIQQEMIAELEQHRPPYVMLDSEFDKIREPNGSSVSTGVHLLDDYIADHYKPVQQYGELTILRRQMLERRDIPQ